MAGELFILEHVFFNYPKGKTILNDVSISLASSGFYFVTGPSGSGKSTFLRLFCRLEEPVSGKIFFSGKLLNSLPPPSLRQRVGYVQQAPIVVAGPVLKNLLLPFTFTVNKDRKPPTEIKLREMMDDFFLEDVPFDQIAETLSIGQKQRLCFIRAMLLEPEVMLMDEPTSALDKKNADIVIQMARKLNRDKNVAVIIVSHNEKDGLDKDSTIIQVKNGKVSLP